MALRQIGKSQVYVVDVEVPTPKTSNGQSYATLYSNLRWKIWEELQKAEEKKLDIEVRTFEQKQKYYEEKKKQLENQILKLKEIKLRKDNGEISGSDAYRLARDTANLELKTAVANASKTTTKVADITDPYSEKPGEVLGQATTTYITSGKGIETPVIDVAAARAKLGEFETPEARKVAINELTTKKAALEAQKAKLDKDFTSKKGRTSDEARAYQESQATLNSQIKDIDSQIYNLETYKAPVSGEQKAEDVVVDFDTEIAALEKKLAGLTAPDASFDTDLINRTRERFAGAAGVGTFYGLDPRKDRILPYFDSSKAVSELQDIAQKSDAAALSAARLDKKKKVTEAKSALDLINSGVVEARPGQKEELEKLILSGESLTGDEEVAVVKASRASLLGQGGALEGARIVPEGSFLSRDKYPEYQAPTSEASPESNATIITEKASELSPIAENIPNDTLSMPPKVAVPASIPPGGKVNVKPLSNQVPRLPASLDNMTPAEALALGALKAPSGIPSVTAPTKSPSVAARIDEDFYNQLFGPTKTSVDLGRKAYGEIPSYPYEAAVMETLKREGPSPLIKPAPIPPAAQLAPNELAIPAEDIRIPQDKNVPLRKPLDIKGIDEELKNDQGKAPTRETRATGYAMKVINKGKDLAQKEKKLARITRKDESGKAVAKNIEIVDKLYEANKGRQDRFKATFDEITRTMEGKMREEAHSYLVAKDIIEGDKSKPV